MVDASYETQFIFHDGKRAKNLAELAAIIGPLDDGEFSQFVNPYKNDFANWTNDVLKEYDLASSMRKVSSKGEMLVLIHRRIIASDAEAHHSRIPHYTNSAPATLVTDALDKKSAKLDQADTRSSDTKQLIIEKKPVTMIGGFFKRKDTGYVQDVPQDAKTQPLSQEHHENHHENHHEKHSEEIKNTKTLHHTMHENLNAVPKETSHMVSNEASHVVSHKTSVDDEYSGASESLVWTVLYGLVIALIVILILYRFVF